MNYIDVIVLLFSLIFLAYGFKNGFLLEIAGILGSIIAIILSYLYPIHRFIKFKEQLPSYILSFIIYFLVIYIIFILISHFLRKTPLGFIDRLLGMVFGFLKGIVICSLILLIISFFPVKSKSIQESYSMKMINKIKPYITNIILNQVQNKKMKI
uniref:CvpA family protein n=1 Tax=candidate division WOR-3 bacterium TaxID=2052148 RepID=A0A7C4U9G7_UNCW3